MNGISNDINILDYLNMHTGLRKNLDKEWCLSLQSQKTPLLLWWEVLGDCMNLSHLESTSQLLSSDFKSSFWKYHSDWSLLLDFSLRLGEIPNAKDTSQTEFMVSYAALERGSFLIYLEFW